MPTWNPDQYLKFAEYRTRPCKDLVAALTLDDVRSVIDLGCGPGTSTRVLADRWPHAHITGLDSSAAMIDVARKEQPEHAWIGGEISEWGSSERAKFDLVFSNAALHWVPDHRELFPKLLARVADGGALAIQIPGDFEAPPHRIMRELAPKNLQVNEWYSHDPAFYYDVLAPHAARVNVWMTEYQHVLPDADAIVEWYKGSGMRPFLEALDSEKARAELISEYTKNIRAAYPTRPDGNVLFPFRRLFVVANAFPFG